MKMLESYSREYRISANDSLRRNSHMNDKVMLRRKDLDQELIDALLVDFVNYIGSRQGLDYGMYVKHFLSVNDRKLSDGNQFAQSKIMF